MFFQTTLAVGRQNGRFERASRLPCARSGMSIAIRRFLQLAQIIQTLSTYAIAHRRAHP